MLNAVCRKIAVTVMPQTMEHAYIRKMCASAGGPKSLRPMPEGRKCNGSKLQAVTFDLLTLAPRLVIGTHYMPGIGQVAPVERATSFHHPTSPLAGVYVGIFFTTMVVILSASYLAYFVVAAFIFCASPVWPEIGEYLDEALKNEGTFLFDVAGLLYERFFSDQNHLLSEREVYARTGNMSWARWGSRAKIYSSNRLWLTDKLIDVGNLPVLLTERSVNAVSRGIYGSLKYRR